MDIITFCIISSIGSFIVIRLICISKFFTYLAFCSINSRRGSTLSPMRMVNTSSAVAASSTSTRRMVRVAGSMVVSQSWSESISPKPL